ncbi:MAG: hypothetical protein ACM3WS_08290 [Bacillota bacterium]
MESMLFVLELCVVVALAHGFARAERQPAKGKKTWLFAYREDAPEQHGMPEKTGR